MALPFGLKSNNGVRAQLASSADIDCIWLLLYNIRSSTVLDTPPASIMMVEVVPLKRQKCGRFPPPFRHS